MLIIPCTAALGATDGKFKSRPDLVTPNKLGGGQNWFQKIDNTNWEAIMQVFESSIHITQ